MMGMDLGSLFKEKWNKNIFPDVFSLEYFVWQNSVHLIAWRLQLWYHVPSLISVIYLQRYLQAYSSAQKNLIKFI